MLDWLVNIFTMWPSHSRKPMPRLSILLLTIISTKYRWARPTLPCLAQPCPALVLWLWFGFCAPLRLFDKSAKSCTKNTPNTTSKLSLRSIGIGALTVQAEPGGRSGGGSGGFLGQVPDDTIVIVVRAGPSQARVRVSPGPHKLRPRPRRRPHHNVNVNAF